MLIFAFREYGAIDDVDIDLHIDVSFLDVSINLYSMIDTFKNIYCFLTVLLEKIKYSFLILLVYADFVKVVIKKYNDWLKKHMIYIFLHWFF